MAACDIGLTRADGVSVEDEDDDDDDFFGGRGKRAMSSSHRPAKRRAPQYEPVLEPKPVEQPASSSRAHSDILVASDVIDLDSDEDESLDDLLEHTSVGYVSVMPSNALAQIRHARPALPCPPTQPPTNLPCMYRF